MTVLLSFCSFPFGVHYAGLRTMLVSHVPNHRSKTFIFTGCSAGSARIVEARRESAIAENMNNFFMMIPSGGVMGMCDCG